MSDPFKIGLSDGRRGALMAGLGEILATSSTANKALDGAAASLHANRLKAQLKAHTQTIAAVLASGIIAGLGEPTSPERAYEIYAEMYATITEKQSAGG